LTRWREERMPSDCSLSDYFGPDPEPVLLGIDNGPRPPFQPHLGWEVLEEKGDHLIVQDWTGAIAEMLRPELGASWRYLRFAIESHADWEKVRDERLNPETPGRLAKDLEERCRETFHVDHPVGVWCGGVYGYLRNWMGLEGISLAIMEDTPWVVEMMTHCTDLTLKLLESIAGKCQLDLGSWWEDMCYNAGPMVSPAWFAAHMAPQYKRITKFLRRECGCDFHWLDCDGRVHELAPLWLEAGVNVLYPMEAVCNDPYQIKDGLGSRLSFRGCFDKRALAAGKAAIDREFERLRPLLERRGFIPDVDHGVPPGVSWENFCYYRERKLQFIGKEPV